MTATRAATFLLALLAGAVAPVAHAASSLNVVVTVAYSSGPCGTAVTRDGVNVFCGPVPVLAPIAAGAGLTTQSGLPRIFASAPPFLGFTGTDVPLPSAPLGPGTTGPAPETSPESEATFRQVDVLPAFVTGHTPLAVYSGGANVTSWRVVSTDNAEHVELTISW